LTSAVWRAIPESRCRPSGGRPPHFYSAAPTGHLFAFRNRRGDRIKLLLWDTDGFLIVYKRLEKGTFRFPAPGEPEATSVTIKATDLIMLLDGVDLQSVKRRPRYVRESE
jgi:transposase